jgi:hypothetical protein
LLAAEFDSGTLNSGNRPTDTAGNTYQRLASVNLGGTFELEIWCAVNIKAAASNVVTITDTNGGVDSICCAEEWSGVGEALAESSQGATGNSANLATSTLTNTSTSALVWVAGASAVATSTLVLGSGFTNLTQNHTAFTNLGIESAVTTSSGTTSPAFTNTSASWACVAVVLRGQRGGFPSQVLVGDGMSRAEMAN